jgi:hypothetical protein
VIKNKHVNEHEVQLDLAIICLRYLGLRCFQDGISDGERRQYALRGYYSFQDYAVANWIKHIDTVIKHCAGIFEGPEKDRLAQNLHQALEEFIHAYPSITQREEPAPSQQQGEGTLSPQQSESLSPSQERQSQLASPEDQCAPFQPYSFHTKLLVVWRHIRDHQSRKFDTRNNISLPVLEAALKKSRAILEGFAPDMVTIGRDTVETYYGAKPFKCPRLLCEFFYLGFAADKDRQHHTNRHDRPFPCPLDGCTQGPFGFASNKDKDRHVRMYHPELADRPPAFVQLTRRPATESARFNCKVPGCGKSFTRNINLKGHVRSHYGDRPFACSTCGKAFARINDCRRHEKIHLKK